MNKGKKVIITVLAILLVASIVLNVYILTVLKKDYKVDKPTTPTDLVENKHEFQVVQVERLNEKLNTLDFSNKTTVNVEADEVDENGEYKPKVVDTISIENNEVIVKNDKGSYKIEVNNPVSVGAKWSVQGEGVSVFYILTSDGKVYRAMSDSGSEKLFRGPEDLGVSNVMSISVPYDFFLNENAFGGEQVYMKTSDGKVYTDESFPDIDDNVVEVIEK